MSGTPKSVPDQGHYEGGDAPWPTELRVFKAAGRLEIDFSDGKNVSLPSKEHRLVLNPESRLRRVTVQGVMRDILAEVAVPAGTASWKQG